VTLESDLVNELILSTLEALKNIPKNDYSQLQIRVDVLQKREVLKTKTLSDLNPTQV
jgi:hypothetical protein